MLFCAGGRCGSHEDCELLVEAWHTPGGAGVVCGPEPPLSRLWKTRDRVPLPRLATSGLSSSSAFCAGESSSRTSNCPIQEQIKSLILCISCNTCDDETTKAKKRRSHPTEDHVESGKVLHSGHRAEGTKVLEQPVLAAVVPLHATYTEEAAD